MMGEGPEQLQGVAVELGNDDTERKLRFIQELHGLGLSDYVDLPQLVVVGDQSSGKSSVLQAITKLPFPVSESMCTRFATEVSLIRSSKPAYMSISIQVGKDHATKTTDEHRKEMDDWKPALTTLDDLNEATFATEFGRLLKEGSEVILGNDKDETVVHDTTLKIELKGPKEINLTIVDIPGLVAVGYPARDTTVSLVQRYIKNPKSIILAIALPTDPMTQQVFKILDKVSNRESRVLGVITKCDRKQRGADDWIFETIKNVRHENVNKPPYLSQGWFGLRNRLPTEQDKSNDERDREEAKFFQDRTWTDLNQPTKLGIENLRAALTRMHNTHITNSIPDLIPEIEQQLADCNLKLTELGRSRTTPATQLESMVNLASQFNSLSINALNAQYDQLLQVSDVKVRKIVQDTLGKFQQKMQSRGEEIFGSEQSFALLSKEESNWEGHVFEHEGYREIREVIRKNPGRGVFGEVNPCVLGILWEQKTIGWDKEATEVINSLVKAIQKAVTQIFAFICPDEELRKNTLQWLLGQYLTQVSQSSMEELQRILADECGKEVWTLHPQRLERLAALGEKRLDAMSNGLMQYWPADQEHRNWIQYRVKVWLKNNKSISNVFDVYDELQVYYEIAMHRFVDNVGLQVVERHLLGPQSPLRIFQPDFVVRTMSERPSLLVDVASENPDKIKKREKLEAEKESLKRALDTARTYGYLL